MLEELAKAMVESTDGPWDYLSPNGQLAAIEQVRAVLECLREPSEAMIEAGLDVLTDHGCNPLTGDTEFTWQAMIDTVLAEGKPHD